MKNLLIVFANGFPYNSSEPFLENEYPLYDKYFDKVIIVTKSKKGEKPTRVINEQSTEVIPDYTLSKNIGSILEAVPYVLTDRMFYKELYKLISNKTFSFKKFYALLVTALCGNHMALKAYRAVKKNPDYMTGIIYAYWLNIPAYAALRLNQKTGNKAYTVSRAHGFDLYVERNSISYLPFQEQIYNNLDEVATISEHGKNYLEDKFGEKDRLSVFRLGASDKNLLNPNSDRDTFKIVSCARVVPLKRLNRIVDALKRITDKNIVWTHIGDGEDFEKLKNYAAQNLPENISVVFKGFTPNSDVYDLYAQTPFHIFVNVSETEGVPVSIMEAMSFGIPAIATSVGGTAELIDDSKNGILLSANFSDADLVDSFMSIINMSEENYQNLRINARKKFENEYRALPNYTRFIEHILIASGRKSNIQFE